MVQTAVSLSIMYSMCKRFWSQTQYDVYAQETNMCNIISQHKVSVKQSWQQTFKVLQEQIPIDGLDGYAKR